VAEVEALEGAVNPEARSATQACSEMLIAHE
jgi:hypothetical protein